MKPLKLVVFCVVMTVISAIGWIIGTMIGNGITQSAPPPTADAASAGLSFLAVCVFNSVLLALLIGTTRSYTGNGRRIALVLYVFTIQFLLPQTETFFFGSQIGIGYAQAASILISGTFVAFATTPLAITLYEKLASAAPAPNPLRVTIPNKKKFLLWAALLIFIGYPFLYLTFGYYIAWQNEHLRVYYTGSNYMRSYLGGFGEAMSNGIYFFQLLRGAIWIVATVPVAVMLKEKPTVQFIVIGILSALLPTALLFIPNPYMPWDIAMTHFVETSSSNFVWGLLMVYMVRISNEQWEHPLTNSNDQ